MSIEKIINGIIDREGGYVNHPDDAGGPTNFGITLKLLRYYNSGATIDDLKRMSKMQAYKIYEGEFYKNTNIEKISAYSMNIAEEVLDSAVNLGPSTAIKILKRCLNALNSKGEIYSDIDVSGGIDSVTLFALQSYLLHRHKDGEEVLLKAMNCLQGARYIELCEANSINESFLYGWLNNRVVL